MKPIRLPRLTQNSRQFTSVTRQIVFYILLVTSVPLILIGLFALRTGNQGIRSHSNAHFASVALIKSQEVERWIAPLTATSSAIARDPGIGESVKHLLSGNSKTSPSDLQRNLEEKLRRFVNYESQLRDIYIIDVDLQFVAATTRLGSHVDAGKALDILKSNSNQLDGFPRHIWSTETASAAISSSIVDGDETIAYVVIIASTLALNQSLVGDSGIGADGNIYMVDASGNLLTESQAVQVGQEVTQISSTLPFVGELVPQISEYESLDGRSVLGAYHPIKPSNWGIVVESPMSSVYSDMSQMRAAMIGALAAFSLSILLVTILVARKITSPVKILTEGADKIGKGDLAHRIDVPGNDELTQLAESFNNMAYDLAHYQSRMVDAEKAAALRSYSEQHVQRLKSLSRLGIIIATKPSVESLVETVPAPAARIVNADVSMLVLFSDHGEEFESVGVWGSGDTEFTSMILTDAKLLQSLKEGLTIAWPTNLASSDSYQAPIDISIDEVGSLLSVPLFAEGAGVSGAFIAINATKGVQFSEEDQEIAQIVGSHVSAAIHRFRKESRLQKSEQKAVDSATELRATQTQLLHSQKMDSIGRLAGGIAHDFNNLLTPIITYSQLIQRQIDPSQVKLRSNLVDIQAAAERAADLASRMLIFSRRDAAEPRKIDLNALIENMERMLGRMIGEEIEILTATTSDLPHAWVDPGQMEQVLVNMAVNARDAMDGGGRLSIETALSINSQTESSENRIVLTISDTGSGMPEEILEQIFEPFFTTKEAGKGTGLGLATCYSIIEQNEGRITVESEEGKGTIFRMYLPIAQGNEAVFELASPPDDAPMPQGSETILLAEDEQAVRDLVTDLLMDLGYTVLKASNGTEAIDLATSSVHRIDLLVSDIVMPQMGGVELANHLRSDHPNLPVLLTSGYAENTSIESVIEKPHSDFCQKPFSATNLANKVRQLLDSD